ncbi:aminoglycoside phosphotransferase family protein [Micropruina sonneratiae]|uniref:aminoglycoside phosphotransferase family protein n=1 Tax=Micropruina sonneratiae TaxID=2986940 RepID=UPI0022264232|nr:aminoglycoside phosphotransferase family protein [Micropruina sp. KQZ13P-5]MCW3157393.1 aminoglycoside phosphotransferase family protein [Micropruina sp. KQZ13P-5]
MLAGLVDAVASLRHRIGAGDDPWCGIVEGLVLGLMAQWRLRSTGEPALAGYGGICVPVIRDDSTPAMLKVSRVEAPRDVENEVLARWGGRDAVRLLERDDERHARLLARLGPHTLTESVDPVGAMEVAGRLAARLAVSPPPGLPRLDAIAAEVADTIDRSTAAQRAVLTAADVRAAATVFRQFGTDQPETLLHGDLQGSNVLRDAEGGWVVIDPLGMVGEPALEALTMLRDRWSQLPSSASPRRQLLRRLHAFADAAAAPRERVVAWTHARCVRAVVDGVADDRGLHAWTARQLGA